MRVTRDENIHVQLPLEKREAGHVAPRDHLVPVDQTDLKLAHGHNLLLRVVQILEGSKKQKKQPKTYDDASNNILMLLY